MDYAFLVLEEHPYGREMLGQLLDAGLVPALLVEECSQVSEVERTKFEARVAGFELPPTFDELLAGREVARLKVPHHNGPESRSALLAASPDLIVLGGTRILTPEIFELAPQGCLNSHPGLLPEVRGSASVAWAIQLDLPVGCTCHFIERDIDTGPIVGRRELPVRRGDTYEKLCQDTIVLAGTLMREAVQSLAAGELRSWPQGDGGPAHRNMPDSQVEQVKQKLADGSYACFVD